MKKGFVKTANYERLLAAYAQLEKRAARERCILLVTGDPGLGKTAAIDRLAVDKNALYIRASSVGGPLALMRALAATNMQIDSRGAAHKIQQAIIAHLVRSDVVIPIIVDECQHLIRSGEVDMIETLRDISDRTECPLILVAGEIGVDMKIARHAQIASRVAETVEFKPFSVADVASVIRRMCEVSLDDQLIIAVHQKTGGKMRLLIEGINRLELFAKNNGMEAVVFADVKENLDSLLCHEWQARRPMRRAV